jgi:hypothetical protein
MEDVKSTAAGWHNDGDRCLPDPFYLPLQAVIFPGQIWYILPIQEFPHDKWGFPLWTTNRFRNNNEKVA